MAMVALALVVSAGLATMLTPLCRNAALRAGFVDKIDQPRKIHVGLIPRTGGIAVALSFFLTMGFMALAVPFYTFPFVVRHGHLLLGGVLIVLGGLVDDLRGANAWLKLAVQITAAAVVVSQGLVISEVALPFGISYSLGIFAAPITIVWIVGITNAVNLVDGLDGLAATTSLLALGAVGLFAFQRGDQALLFLATTLSGATLGFLVYNLHPASVFMGDTGSQLLGFMLSVLTLLVCNVPLGGETTLVVPAVIMGLPVIDTISAIVRRVRGRRSVFTGDREHLHHRLLDIGLAQPHVLLVLSAVGLLFELAALLIAHQSLYSELAGVLLTAMLVSGCVWLYSPEWLGTFRRTRTVEVNAPVLPILRTSSSRHILSTHESPSTQSASPAE